MTPGGRGRSIVVRGNDSRSGDRGALNSTKVGGVGGVDGVGDVPGRLDGEWRFGDQAVLLRVNLKLDVGVFAWISRRIGIGEQH